MIIDVLLDYSHYVIGFDDILKYDKCEMKVDAASLAGVRAQTFNCFIFHYAACYM